MKADWYLRMAVAMLLRIAAGEKHHPQELISLARDLENATND